MAKLLRMPSQAIIDLFAGVIDFYLWKGIPCARAWPRYKPRTPSPIELANQQAFAYVNQQWASLDIAIKEQWNAMAGGTHLTGKDLSVRAYLKGTRVSLDA